MKSAPMINAAAAAWGVPMPPAVPTLILFAYLYFAIALSRNANIVGRSAYATPPSVWPPESASTQMSSATGSDWPSSASSVVKWPEATKEDAELGQSLPVADDLRSE